MPIEPSVASFAHRLSLETMPATVGGLERIFQAKKRDGLAGGNHDYEF